MSTIIDTKDLKIIESGTLKNGTAYDLAEMTPQHIADCTALHQAIIDALPADQKTYILPKTADYFFSHFSGYNGNAIMGVIIGGHLAAQAVITQPDYFHSDNGMADMPDAPPSEQTSILQAVSVHPAFRGMGIMNRLVHHWIDHAHEMGRKHLLAEIDIRNQASWGAFVTGGMKLISMGMDPSDGTLVYNAHELTAAAIGKRLTSSFNKAAAKTVGAAAFAVQDKLFDDGYAIVAWDRAKQTVTMTPQ